MCVLEDEGIVWVPQSGDCHRGLVRWARGAGKPAKQTCSKQSKEESGIVHQ
jgi:hypothetical protein